MEYNVIIPKSVIKVLELLNIENKTRILIKLKALRNVKEPMGAIKMKGLENRYRIRVGSYRIIYCIIEEERTIQILDIAHRKDIYKKK